MGLFSALKAALSSGAKQINKDYGKSPKFLKAVCASTALVIWADGEVEDSETKKAMEVLTGHAQLSALYSPVEIETAFKDAMKHGSTLSGKQQLARDLDGVLGTDFGQQMPDDVYLLAADVASSNSHNAVGEKEQAVLDKLAKHLHVDIHSFEFA